MSKKKCIGKIVGFAVLGTKVACNGEPGVFVVSQLSSSEDVSESEEGEEEKKGEGQGKKD